MADYSTYTFADMFNALSLVYSINWDYKPVRGSKNEFYTTCPLCGGENCSLNFAKNLGRCFGSKKVACDKSWNPDTFGATITGVSYADFDHIMRAYLKGEAVNTNGNNKVSYRKVTTEYKEDEEINLASDDILNDTYGALLSYLPLTERDNRDLLLRGFKQNEIAKLRYKSYSIKNEDERNRVADNLINKGCQLENVPGFYVEKDNWTMKKNLPVVMIPVINEKQQLVGLQQRKHNEDVNEAKKIKKIGWFSSNGENKGTKRPIILHFACTFVRDLDGTKRPFFKDDTVYFTEGPMKADIIHLLENVGVIAVPGVNNRKIITEKFDYFKSLGIKKFVDYLDMDYVTNKTVKLHLQKLKDEIIAAGFEYERKDWDMNIPNSNKKLKGRDDYLMYHMRNIIPR